MENKLEINLPKIIGLLSSVDWVAVLAFLIPLIISLLALYVSSRALNTTKRHKRLEFRSELKKTLNSAQVELEKLTSIIDEARNTRLRLIKFKGSRHENDQLFLDKIDSDTTLTENYRTTLDNLPSEKQLNDDQVVDAISRIHEIQLRLSHMSNIYIEAIRNTNESIKEGAERRQNNMDRVMNRNR